MRRYTANRLPREYQGGRGIPREVRARIARLENAIAAGTVHPHDIYGTNGKRAFERVRRVLDGKEIT